MRCWLIRRRWLGEWMLLGIAAAIMQVMAWHYWSLDDIGQADLSALNGHKIAIDPGHGGIDSGAARNGLKEKDINLDIGRHLGAMLKQHGAEVTLTRDSDVDYYTRGRGGKAHDLRTRCKLIDDSGVEVFVSIHVNAYRGAELSGAQVFYNPRHPDNKILAEIAQRALGDCPPGNRFQARQDLRIILLKETNTPGILVETGYLSTKEEAGRLADEAYQQKLADRIAKALAYHFTHKPGN